jgi:flavodoxin
MHTAVIVDSEFGNTYAIAETIAAELRTAGSADVMQASTHAWAGRC